MYFQIKQFKGLDTRRSLLTSEPGTMDTLQNMHVNQGGELEKRKAFVPEVLPHNTFGLQETSNGVAVFSSAALDKETWTGNKTWPRILSGSVYYTAIDIPVGDPHVTQVPYVGEPIIVAGSTEVSLNGTWVVGYVLGSAVSGWQVGFITGFAGSATPITETATITPQWPTIMEYVQLVHPLGSSVTLTGIPSSTYYNGSTFAITTWSNGDTLAYYGTTVIPDFYVGMYGNITPNAYEIARSLTTQLTASGAYTTTGPTLASLTVQVTGGTTSPGNAIFLSYNFNRDVTLDLGGGSSVTASVFLLNPGGTEYNTDANTTAADLKTAIDADGYGFTVVRNGSILTITPPATDFNGAALGVNGNDTLEAICTGIATVYIPTPSAVFDVFSIPSQSSGTPYSVSTVATDATLQYKLVSNGQASSAPVGATGQVTLVAGTDNAFATGTISIAGTLNVAEGDTVTIGTTTYTFTATITGVANLVLIGAAKANTLANLVAAINLTAGAGTSYSASTVANSYVSAAAPVAGVVTLTSSRSGSAGNSIVLSKVSTNITVGAFAGGGTDVNQITSISVGGVNVLSAVIPFNKDVTTTAADIVANINAYQGTSGFKAVNNAGVINLIAINSGASTNNAVIITTAGGDVCFADCHFIVSGTGDISIIQGNNAANMLTATITFRSAGFTTESLADYAGRVVANINANTAVSGYLACSVSNQIWISSKVVSNIDIPENILITNTMTIQVGETTVLKATVNTYTIGFVGVDAVTTIGGFNGGPGFKSAASNDLPNSAMITMSGGVPPYKYKWSGTSSFGGQLISAALGKTPARYAPTFNVLPQVVDQANQWWKETSSNYMQATTTTNLTWFCNVTDSATIPATLVVGPFYLLAFSN